MGDEKNVVTSSKYGLSSIPEVPIIQYLFERLRKQVPRVGDKPWVTDVLRRNSLTFSEVEPLSRKVASGLTKKGFKKGELLYFITNDMCYLDLFILGAWLCNGAVRGGCPSDRAEDHLTLIKQSQARFLLCDPETASTVQTIVSQLGWKVVLLSIGDVDGATSIQELLQDDGKACPENLKINVFEDIIFFPTTGGSTGLPKAAQHTHRSLVSFLSCGRYCISEEPTLLSFSNFHIGGLVFSLNHLTNGISIFTMPVFSEKRFLEAIQEYKPTIIGGFPHVLTWLSKTSQADDYDLTSVKSCFTGGANVSGSMLKDLKRRFPHITEHNILYGQTEIFMVSSNLCDSLNGVEKRDSDSTIPSSGSLIPIIQAKVVSIMTGETLGRNEDGELLFKSPSQMIGYQNQPKETADAIDKDGWLHTGDIGHFDERGCLYIVDRLKATFKYLANHISPSELESIIETHPAVMMAGVVGVPDPTCVALPRAYVVKRPGKDVSQEDIIKYVADRTPDFKHLRGGVRFIASLPLSSAEKISRPGLAKLVAQDGEN